jgi:hypothetical protein
MEPRLLLVLQMVGSFTAWGVIASVVVIPYLRRLDHRRALLVVTLPQLFRHAGATQLSPMVGPAMPAEWAWHVASGDAVTVVLAVVAVVALHRGARWATAATWAVHLVGFLDASFNGFNAARLQVAPHLGGAWYIVAFLVPLVFTSHILAFRWLIDGWRGARAGARDDDSRPNASGDRV